MEILTLKISHSLSQDSVGATVVIKEEGLEAFADLASPDSGHYQEDAGQDDENDPDYQVDMIKYILVLCSLFLYSINACLSISRYAA